MKKEYKKPIIKIVEVEMKMVIATSFRSPAEWPGGYPG